jgi:hypothetical protein
MTSFFQSSHCQSQAHCRTCRDFVNGASFRASLQSIFKDLATPDFPCPKGLPWTPISTSKTTPSIEEQFLQAKSTILTAPDTHFWPLLKEELRLTEFQLDLHQNQTPCWKSRQKSRLIHFLATARQKMPPHPPF